MVTNRSHRILDALLRRDQPTLQRQYQVRCIDDRRIDITGVELPAGWNLAEITVRVELPEHYPEAAPRWRFPGTLRYQGRVPRHLLTSGQWLCRGTLGDDFIWWPAKWDPPHSTIRGGTDQALADLITVDEPDTVEEPNA